MAPHEDNVTRLQVLIDSVNKGTPKQVGEQNGCVEDCFDDHDRINALELKSRVSPPSEAQGKQDTNVAVDIFILCL